MFYRSLELATLRIAGDLLFATSGFHYLQGNFQPEKEGDKSTGDAQKNDIALSPLAIPMLTGPGSISLLIDILSRT
jgi:multiple antibiotic resistance protein